MENFKKAECEHLNKMVHLFCETKNLNMSNWAVQQLEKAHCYDKEDGEFVCEGCPLTIEWKPGILKSDGTFVEVKTKPIETIEECLERMRYLAVKYHYPLMMPHIEFLEEKFEEMKNNSTKEA